MCNTLDNYQHELKLSRFARDVDEEGIAQDKGKWNADRFRTLGDEFVRIHYPRLKRWDFVFVLVRFGYSGSGSIIVSETKLPIQTFFQVDWIVLENVSNR